MLLQNKCIRLLIYNVTLSCGEVMTQTFRTNVLKQSIFIPLSDSFKLVIVTTFLTEFKADSRMAKHRKAAQQAGNSRIR